MLSPFDKKYTMDYISRMIGDVNDYELYEEIHAEQMKRFAEVIISWRDLNNDVCDGISDSIIPQRQNGTADQVDGVREKLR